MLTFTIIWVLSIVAAIAVSIRTPWWLIWRLFLIIPLAAEIVLFSPLGNAGKDQLPQGVQPLNIWIWAAIVFVYGVIFYGPSAIALGGLGWILSKQSLAVVAKSKSVTIVSATLIGTIVGGAFWIAYEIAVYKRDLTDVWFIASVVGGAAGGFLVGYYGMKNRPSGGLTTDATSIARA